jgi:hypothetical protein
MTQSTQEVQHLIRRIHDTSLTHLRTLCHLRPDTGLKAAIHCIKPFAETTEKVKMGNSASVAKPEGVASLHDLKGIKNIDGELVDFEALKGKVSGTVCTALDKLRATLGT